MPYEPLYTAEEMRAAEAAYAGPTLELMERAGKCVAEEILARFPDARQVAVWCATGANGGDGLVAAASSRARALPRRCACSGRIRRSQETRPRPSLGREAGVPFVDEHGPATWPSTRSSGPGSAAGRGPRRSGPSAS